MVGIKSYWLIGLMISTSYAILTMIYLLRYPIISVLVNRSVLCNSGIEEENHFLLESLATCQDSSSKLVIYFTVNTTFVKYLDQFPN